MLLSGTFDDDDDNDDDNDVDDDDEYYQVIITKVITVILSERILFFDFSFIYLWNGNVDRHLVAGKGAGFNMFFTFFPLLFEYVCICFVESKLVHTRCPVLE